MANKFCRQLSNGYKINIHDDVLHWSPCCFYSKRVNMYDTETWKKEMEYARSATGWIPECEGCRVLEETGVEMLKPRLQCNTWIPEDSEDGDCVNLEISFDTKCNAACISCGSYCSTTWAKFDKKHNLNLHDAPLQLNLKSKLDRKLAGFKYGITLQDDDTDISGVLFRKLLSLVPLDKLRNVFVLGGEPLYTSSHMKMLKHLKEVHPDLSKVSLRYQSNGSIYPSDEVLKYWEDYQSIIFGVSFDAIGERFNYMRWPLKWKKASENLIRLMTETDCRLHVNATLSPLNIYYYDELNNWLQDNIPVRPNVRPNDLIARTNPCQGEMDLRFTSQRLYDKIMNKYGDGHNIAKLYSSIKIGDDYRPMFGYIEQMDKLRRLDWRKTFPDVVDCYDF